MRIIAGTARGTVIDAPLGRDTRPTLDRVRENVFNILQQQVRGARVLDLFSGSGAMAFEAVSRGLHPPCWWMWTERRIRWRKRIAVSCGWTTAAACC